MPVRTPTYGVTRLPGFAGGLNLRDALTELAADESPDLSNVTLDERGGAASRLGMSKWNASAAANLFTSEYPSAVAGKILWYSKADGKLYSDPGTGVLTLRRTWTSGSDISMVDFAGKVYAQHPVDGLYSSTDGVTWTIVVAATGTAPVGTLLAVWQNKLWSAGDPTYPLRLTWCAPGDATKYATGDGGGTNDIREKDDAPIIGLQGGSGFDFQTSPSLVIFKSRSSYRVTNSTTGAYVTLDAAVGTASRKSFTTSNGMIYTLSTLGIFRTDGFNKLTPVADGKLQPLFDPVALAHTYASNFAAGAQGDRVYFSLTRQGSTTNDLALELAVPFQAFTSGTNAMAGYVSYTTGGDTLIGTSPTVTGQTYHLNTGGTDDGTAITSRIKTRVFEPAGGYRARMQELQILGRGVFTVTTHPDFSTSAGPTESVSIVDTAGAVWDTDLWDTGVFGDESVENYATCRPRTLGRAFQIQFDASTSTTTTAPRMLGGGTALTVGAVAVYGVTAKYAPLGTA